MYLAFILAVKTTQLKWSISKQACIEMIHPRTQAWSRCLAGRYQPLTPHKHLSCPGWGWICKEPVRQHPAYRWAREAVREKRQDSRDGLHHGWRCSEKRIWHVCFLFILTHCRIPFEAVKGWIIPVRAWECQPAMLCSLLQAPQTLVMWPLQFLASTPIFILAPMLWTTPQNTLLLQVCLIMTHRALSTSDTELIIVPTFYTFNFDFQLELRGSQYYNK